MLINTLKVKEFQKLYDKTNVGINVNTDLRISLLKEELEELIKAYEKKDEMGILDAYGDMLFIILGSIYYHGLENEFEKYFECICESNLSKHDITEHDAIKTKEKYDKENIETYYIQKDKNVFVTMKKSDNKILKSYNYKTPLEIYNQKYKQLNNK